jgi:hypothetical protein
MFVNMSRLLKYFDADTKHPKLQRAQRKIIRYGCKKYLIILSYKLRYYTGTTYDPSTYFSRSIVYILGNY